MAAPDSRTALGLWRGALVEIIRRRGPDLSTRQMAIFLTVGLIELIAGRIVNGESIGTLVS